MFQIAKVAVEKTAISFDKAFDYYIPTYLEETLQVGCRVVVPFGGYNKRRIGMVLDITESISRENIKPISSQLDSQPILSQEGIQIVNYLNKYTFCTLFDGVKMLIPPGASIQLGVVVALNQERAESLAFTVPQNRIVQYLQKQKKPCTKEKLCRELELLPDNKALEQLLHLGVIEEKEKNKQKIQDSRAVMACLVEGGVQEQKLTPKQTLVVEMLKEQQSASVKEICYCCGVGKQVVEKVEKAGYITLYEQEVYRNPYPKAQEVQFVPEELTLQQQQAYETLEKLTQSGKSETALLHGVTGSGKTNVFLQLIHSVLEQGKNVIVMVPEIALTPQTVHKFQTQFGTQVAVLHSSLTMSQRMDEWKRIRTGQVRIVIGTRSAVFAPLANIGLIVMDEEQEHTYKSDSAPRFHARDVAAFRSRYHGAVLLLASATPSIESYYQAEQGNYTLVSLTQRYAGMELPDVYIVDMRDKAAESSAMAISQRIVDELYHNLVHKQQSILLLNRRGYHTMMKCSLCGEAVSCPNCSVTLTYHQANHSAMCHYCGYQTREDAECNVCHGKMVRLSGVGTQRVEEQLQKLFPDARILRMDMDTTMSRHAYEEKFDAFSRGEYDIMVGTQMVAKGLDFPNVTMVGVLTADQALFSQNFRGYERAFSLITQVVGRGGRGKLPGRAFIQTTTPDNPVIQLAARQDYQAYYQEELLFRKLNLYPPYCRISAIGFSGEDEKLTEEAAQECAKLLTTTAKELYAQLPIRVLSPTTEEVQKVAGKYRYKILIKHNRANGFYELIWSVMTAFGKITRYKAITVHVDMNYDG